jgi:hypothetical protein
MTFPILWGLFKVAPEIATRVSDKAVPAAAPSD